MLLEITHVEDAHDPRYIVLADGATYIITGRGEGIVLADSTVSTPHAKITLRKTDVVVEDLGSTSGTFIDDEQVTGPTVVEIGQPIRVGESLLKVTLGERAPVHNYWEARELTPTEEGFLATLRANPADDASRTVYADWLEGEGFPITAYYIRRELADQIDISTDDRLERAVIITRPTWRAVICRSQISGCRLADCPRRWSLLPPTSNDLVRTCTVCSKPVYFCASGDDVDRHTAARNRMAFDANLSQRAPVERTTGRWTILDYDDDDDFGDGIT